MNKDFLEEWFLSNDGYNWRVERPGITGPGRIWGDGTAALNFLAFRCVCCSVWQQSWQNRDPVLILLQS